MAKGSFKHRVRFALPMAFLAAAAIAGCTGMGEESGTRLGLGETFDQVRRGAWLILRYDAEANAFAGTVENTTGATLPRVRVEVHLSNGTELGPTTPVDLAPGEKIDVMLQATAEPFTGWSAHAEVGGDGRGEHGPGGEHRGERAEAQREHGERGDRGGEHSGGE